MDKHWPFSGRIALPRFSLRTALLAFTLAGPLFLVFANIFLYYEESRGIGFFRAWIRPTDAKFAVGPVTDPDGIGRAIRSTPISDGTVVLFRKGGSFGAFIPVEQTNDPEILEYQWYYRLDGKSRLDVEQTQVFQGQGTVSASAGPVKVMFGPFSIGWSGNDNGYGFLYYAWADDADGWADDTEVCVTNKNSLAGVDLRGKEWRFLP